MARVLGSSAEDIQSEILNEMARQLSQYLPADVDTPLGSPVACSLNETGSVRDPLQLPEDFISFEPWGLAICDDFLGHRLGVEPAAVGAMLAADRVAGWAAGE